MSSSAQPSTSCGRVCPWKREKILLRGDIIARVPFLTVISLNELCLWWSDVNLIFPFLPCIGQSGGLPASLPTLVIIFGTVGWAGTHLSVGLFPPLSPSGRLGAETAAPVFCHDMSLHVRRSWWRPSAWHAHMSPWLTNPLHTQHTLYHTQTNHFWLTSNPTHTHSHLFFCFSNTHFFPPTSCPSQGKWDEQIGQVQIETVGASRHPDTWLW